MQAAGARHVGAAAYAPNGIHMSAPCRLCRAKRCAAKSEAQLCKQRDGRSKSTAILEPLRNLDDRCHTISFQKFKSNSRTKAILRRFWRKESCIGLTGVSPHVPSNLQYDAPGISESTAPRPRSLRGTA